MTDENQLSEVVAADPAPEPEATAAPEPVETPTEALPEEKPAKSFSQEELDAMVGKRLARERRKWEREQALKAQPATSAPAELPSKMEDPDAYAEALAERKATELLAKREAEREMQAIREAYHDREEAARDKYEDF